MYHRHDAQARATVELYRFLKLTRLVKKRIVNLYRQTKVDGGVYRSLGRKQPLLVRRTRSACDFLTPIIRDLGPSSLGHSPTRDLCAVHGEAWGPSGGKDLTFPSGISTEVSSDPLASGRHDSSDDRILLGAPHAAEEHRGVATSVIAGPAPAPFMRDELRGGPTTAAIVIAEHNSTPIHTDDDAKLRCATWSSAPPRSAYRVTRRRQRRNCVL